MTPAIKKKKPTVYARRRRILAIFDMPFYSFLSYLNTEGNGKWTVGRFVTNDGVHVYRE